jgi:hypothetical protein
MFMENYRQVMSIMKKEGRVTAAKITTQLGGGTSKERTVYRVLTKMQKDKVARKEGRDFVYAPHDILRDRWLNVFDLIFGKLFLAGYDLDFVLKTQAFIITPRNIGFCPANPDSMKKLIEDFELAPPGGVVGRFAAVSQDIKKGQPVSLVPRDSDNEKKE